MRGQKETSPGGLQIRGGRMRITGLQQPRQTGAIEADIAGSLPDALTLLREPRLGLLDRHPVDLKNPAGQATAKLSLSLPLEETVRIEDIPIRVQAKLDGVRLTALVAGQDLEQGVLDLTATNDGMKIGGRALLASIPTKLDATMDFRSGPPSQVVQSVTVTGAPDARQLAAAGLDATAIMSGAAQVQAVLTERRNGQGDVAVTADLGGAELSVGALEWRKPRDVAAKATARLLLERDRLTAIDAIQVDGEGLALRGRAEFAGTRLSVFRMERLVLGRTVAQGTLTLPADGAMAIAVSGATLDLAPRLSRKTTPQATPRGPKPEPPAGPPWRLDATFDRVLMANDRVASGVVLHAQNDGRVVRQFRMDGRFGARGAFTAQIVSERAGRRLTATAEDAGELLRGLDYIRSMQGGRLSVQAVYDDAQAGRPLAGTADIEDFRVREAPALGKLLQAMTLYGLVEVMQGPGLGFSRMVAPFRLTEDALELADARAFSPSLGLTAKGRLDLNAERIDMQGTIVPAYFFNSLLGNIPLVGKLFSPERGGGVFAASYALRGRLADPDVSVNPLAALTPGSCAGCSACSDGRRPIAACSGTPGAPVPARYARPGAGGNPRPRWRRPGRASPGCGRSGRHAASVRAPPAAPAPAGSSWMLPTMLMTPTRPRRPGWQCCCRCRRRAGRDGSASAAPAVRSAAPRVRAVRRPSLPGAPRSAPARGRSVRHAARACAPACSAWPR
ncbi:MAG: AsmA-like C-terminal region-containing protein [Acetobacteraceae bacterium]